LIGHNVFYDLDWLLDYGIMPHDVHDTMVLFHRFYPELPKSLAFCNMWFTDIPYYKDDGKTWGRNKPDEQLWEYNIKDVVSDHRVWRALNELGRSPGRSAATMELYNNYTRACMPLAFEMQTLGMDADGESVLFAKAILLAELDKIRGKLDALSGGELVIRPGNKKITDQQAAKYLYQTLKLPPKYNRKTKSLTADEDALVELLIKFPDLEVLKALNAERKFGKALNSYIDISWRQNDKAWNKDSGAASTLVETGRTGDSDGDSSIG
jgi:DNA polymerase I-like protein with 3'-5' exonuclease and polymerase domains